MNTESTIQFWRTDLEPPKKTIYTSNGYVLSEITRNDDGEQKLSYEITDPSGSIIEASDSARDALVTLSKIIFSKTGQTTFFNVPKQNDIPS